MEKRTFETVYQVLEAETTEDISIIERNFSSTTLYLPGDHFRYNGQSYIVKRCHQVGDEVWRNSAAGLMKR